MKIAILGGTGKLGFALATRIHRSGFEVIIGSREVEKAQDSAASLGAGANGVANTEAAKAGDLAIISVPYAAHRTLLDQVGLDLAGKIIVDATVPLDPGNILQIKTESGRSAAEETAAAVPGADVFAGFQTISHRVLRDLDAAHDVLIAGGPRRKSELLDWMRSIRLHPIDVGPLEVSGHLERMTALLLSVNKANKVKESGIKITGIA